MHDPEAQISRRMAIKGTAAAGVGLVGGGAFANGLLDNTAIPPEALMISNDEWFAQRAWSVSANKVLGATTAVTSLAKRIYRPKSAEEIAEIVKSLPAATPIACVCGGHESSNAAMVASGEAVILDLIGFKSIEFHQSGGTPDDESLVTVGSGVVFRELVEAVKLHGGALPVGTGPGVGVAGYVTNGGLSSYFSRRLGLLGQRVVKMTVVTPAGEIRVLTPKDELFTAMLGAGSSLAIVVDLTLRLADASVVKFAEQRVFGFETREQAVHYSHEAMRFMREHVIPNESVSLDFVGKSVVGEAPLDEAQLSIVEIRSLGGAAQKGARIPTGNCHHAFFVDLITLYDAKAKSTAERKAIVDGTDRIVDQARAIKGLGVDFSGTHSQPDDVGRTGVAAEIFGSAEMAATVRRLKKQVDPENRLRFHPFAKFIA
jgi:FAD/FMN-containing dehydrogenase